MKRPGLDPVLDADFLSACISDEDDASLVDVALAPEDDQLVASSVAHSLFTCGKNGINGFSVIPSWVVTELARARAHNAALLVCAILKRMRMRRATTIPLTSTVWAEIDAPSECERQTILRHLRRVPGVLKLERRHQRYTRYQVTLGDGWSP
jgi:hypothetical protein